MNHKTFSELNLTEDQFEFLESVLNHEANYWTEYYDSVKDGENKEEIELIYQKFQMIVDTADKIKSLRN